MTLLHIVLSIIGTLSWATEVNTAPPVDIYWNKTNNIFSRANNDHIIEVQIQERIRFFCPYYESESESAEHYIIYRLPKHYYDGCYIPENANEGQLRSEFGIEKVHNCSSPYNPSNFISLIRDFGALPGIYGGLNYEAGKEYYFTSISTGEVNGIHNRLSTNSACRRFNMKAIIRVCCNENATHSCPSKWPKCVGNPAGFTDPPIVTGETNPPPLPPSTRPATTTKRTTVKLTEQPNASWTTLRKMVTTKQPETNQQANTNANAVGASSVTTASILTITFGLILNGLTWELT